MSAAADPFDRLGQVREQIAGERTVSRPLNDGLILDALEALADAYIGTGHAESGADGPEGGAGDRPEEAR